ncbi:MAG TPA: phage minor capsid protein, partial [Naasia sp.]
GFQHPNCRHTVKLYLPGVTKAPTGPGTGPDPKGDEARQRQRAIEREIRRHKRGADLALDAPARKAANTRVREWQARMREHLAEHPELRRLTYREAPGVGNTPPVDLVERLGGDTPFPDLPREQVDEPEVQERPEPVEEPAVEEPQAEEQEPAAEERPARALPVVDEAAVEARAKAVEKVLRPFRDVFDPLQLRGVIRDHLREAYPDVPVRERRELERTLARAGARTSTPPGRGIRLALRAQARRAAAAADGRTAAELVELARTVVGDVALFGRTADGRMDLDRDGGYSAATRAKLDAVRTVGAAVRAEVDRRIEALAQAAQPSEGGARPRIVATNSAARRRTEAEIRRAVLAELRPMGRNGRDEIPIRYHPSLSDPADQETYGGMVRRAQDVYPTAWLAGNRAAQRGGLIVQAKGDAASMGNRAYYDPTFHLIETGRYSDPQQAEAIVIHELGHAMEKTLPWIRQAERVFLHDRISRGKPGKRTADEASVIYEGTDELGFEDDFPQHYTGKTYGDGSDRQAFEVLTTGVQHLLGGDGDYADGDMEDFILGMLAVL